MLTKETLDSWYTPRHLKPRCECLTEEEELVAEDVKVCSLCDGRGEVDRASSFEDEDIVPCPECNSDYYEDDYMPDLTKIKQIYA